MKKKSLLTVLIIMMLASMLFVLTGCKNNEGNNATNNTTGSEPIKFESNIELDKKTYIEQLKKVQINGTDDYLIINEKRKWEVPDHPEGATISFTIAIPYTLHVDGKDYSATYELGSGKSSGKDNNPKYEFTITNLTKDYETEVLIKKK